MVDQVRLYTLGSLAVRNASDRAIKFVSHKVEALLVYLACNREEFTRARLAELFWGELGEERALANLRLAVFDIQKAVKTLLTTTRQTLQISDEIDCWVDLIELVHVLDTAEQEWQTCGSFSFSTAEQLKVTLQLYQGDFLAGFKIQENPEFEQWVVEVQENTRMRVLSMLSLLVRHYTEASYHTEAYRQARRLLELDPLWEQAYRQMMYLLTRSGQRQKAIAQYKQCCDILQRELGVEPEVATADLMQRIQAGEIATVPEPPPPIYRVPEPTDQFVGREPELQQLLKLIDRSGVLLITVLGMGGIGKTRLVIEAAQQRRAYFRDGVYFIEMGSLPTLDFIAATIAHMIDMPVDNTFSDRDLIDYLHSKELLLILDSADHFVSQLSDVDIIRQITTQIDTVKVLVTSREMLKLPGESPLALSGLRFPDTSEIPDFGKYDAVRLFVQAAQRVSDKFSLPGNESAVLRICELLEGLPIGLELTASWLRVINCEEIVKYLEENFDLLLTPAQDVSPYQRSIRAMLSRSWDLLTANEKEALARLSVFSGGFDLQAAQEGLDVSIFLLESLVTKSLLQFDGETRYRFHDLIRLFALVKLAELGVEEQARKMQLAYFVKMAQEAQEQLAGAEQNKWLKRLDIEIENMRAVLAWALENARGREAMIIAASISSFWLNTGYLAEGLSWLERALTQTTGDMMTERADALTRAASVAMLTKADSSIDGWLVEGLSIYRHLGDLQGVASTLRNMANLERRRGNYGQASKYFQECISTFEQCIVLYKTMKSDVVARPLNDLGVLYLEKGDFSQARDLFLESLPLSRKRNDTRNIASALSNLGATGFGQGNYTEAMQHLEEALTLHRGLQNRVGISATLTTLAKIAIEKDDFEKAQELVQEALEIAKESTNKFEELEALWTLGDIELKRRDFPETESHYRASLAISQSLGNQLYIAHTLGRFGCLRNYEENMGAACSLLGFASALHAEMGVSLSVSEHARYDYQIADLKSKLGEDTFTKYWTEAQNMTIKDILKII